MYAKSHDKVITDKVHTIKQAYRQRTSNVRVRRLRKIKMAEALDQFDSILDCPICLEPMVDPMVLPCHHSFCKECVERLKQGDLIKCPLDNKVFNFKDVQKDFRFSHIRERLEQKSKASSKDKSTSGLCNTCEENKATTV